MGKTPRDGREGEARRQTMKLGSLPSMTGTRRKWRRFQQAGVVENCSPVPYSYCEEPIVEGLISADGAEYLLLCDACAPAAGLSIEC
jgi:hypothetical protein